MSEGFAAIRILARTHMHRLPAIEIITPKYHWFELPPPSHIFVRWRLAAGGASCYGHEGFLSASLSFSFASLALPHEEALTLG